MSRYIKFDDAVKVMACEMYAEAQSQGYDVDGIEDFMPEAKAWLNDAPTINYYNSNIPCGSTPSACKEADKFVEEFVEGLKKLQPKVEPQTYITEDRDTQILDAWQVHHRSTTSVEDEPQTDCAWK